MLKKNPNLQNFFKAILSLKTLEECDMFFDDICTIQEIEALSQRFEVAMLLCEGKSYNDINRITGASTTTIGRVSKCLNYGDGGYKTAIERIKETAND
ncbi:MAG: hypothetical protein IJ948_01560 [Clostridia bacterium]|nr:hypothetical protein [Clostridia bacterium]